LRFIGPRFCAARIFPGYLFSAPRAGASLCVWFARSFRSLPYTGERSVRFIVFVCPGLFPVMELVFFEHAFLPPFCVGPLDSRVLVVRLKVWIMNLFPLFSRFPAVFYRQFEGNRHSFPVHFRPSALIRPCQSQWDRRPLKPERAHSASPLSDSAHIFQCGFVSRWSGCFPTRFCRAHVFLGGSVFLMYIFFSRLAAFYLLLAASCPTLCSMLISTVMRLALPRSLFYHARRRAYCPTSFVLPAA